MSVREREREERESKRRERERDYEKENVDAREQMFESLDPPFVFVQTLFNGTTKGSSIFWLVIDRLSLGS